MRGCVGSIDGIFLCTKCPSKSDVHGNKISYYSGHYKSHGLNIQAVCDSRLQFMYLGVVGKVSTNDAYSYASTGLSQRIKKLPLGRMYLVGDSAYPISNHLLTPFTGSQRENQDRYEFNYFLSQMRIIIEMAFGYLTSK